MQQTVLVFLAIVNAFTNIIHRIEPAAFQIDAEVKIVKIRVAQDFSLLT